MNKNKKDNNSKLLEDIRHARPVVHEAKELVDLCKQIVITNSEPSAVYGSHWCVYSHPIRGRPEINSSSETSNSQDTDFADILIHIHPKELDADYSALGIRIALVSMDGYSMILSQGALNEDGQIWFKNVGENSYFIFIDKHDFLKEKTEDMEIRQLAALKWAALGPEDRDLRWTCEHHSGLATAVVQPSYEDSHAVLTISADKSLAGRTVVFAIGSERCRLILPTTGECEVSHDFKAKFSDLREGLFEFSFSISQV
jgi:hypothetical protein